MLKKLFFTTLFLSLVLAVVGAGFLFWGYHYITRDLPRLSGIEDYTPAAVSKVYSNDETLIAEFFKQRRYPAKLAEVPDLVQKAFVAAEDASFYKHPGIDLMGIIRAFVRNLQEGAVTQGGSTITQQVVKNLLLTPEKNYERKIKEAILAYRIEQNFSKDEILEIYLNQIFFGAGAYGIKSAARTYYRKELSELTLAEGALLAGLPQAPSRYSPTHHLPRAQRRQRYVLNQMVRAEFITEQEAKEAAQEKLQIYSASARNIFHAPYYASEVRRVFADKFRNLDIDVDGLEIHTAVDITASRMAERALGRGLREVDKRKGWRGPIGHIEEADSSAFVSGFFINTEAVPEPDTVYPALVTEIANQTVKVDLGFFKGELDLAEAAWARRMLDSDGKVTRGQLNSVLRAGDVIEVSLELSKEVADLSPESDKEENSEPAEVEEIQVVKVILDQTPELQGAIVLLDPHSGDVVALQGGYSYQQSVFNRATQALRQPGSAFKPLIYLAAIDNYHYTPATIVYDEPRTFRAGRDHWAPRNFDKKFLGPMTLRVALEKSRNVISADITSRIGVDAVIKYARKLGISSRMGRNLSLSLGSSEVTVLEITRAYGVFASRGVLFPSVIITRVVDRNGEVIFDYDRERLSRAERVIDTNSAFIMANMMKGVVESGTGHRVRALGRPAAGKTGTSNDLMDAWYVGFTPEWVAGVWIGYDEKKTIGDNETGGRVSAPIWLELMQDFLAYQDSKSFEKLVQDAKEEADRLGIEYWPPEPLEAMDFSPPDGVDPYWINKESGRLANMGGAGAIYEYFLKGTEPSIRPDEGESSSSYLESPYL